MEIINKRQKLVLKKIIDSQHNITATQLATFVQSSVRTIKSDIVYINSVINDRGIKINSKARIGYWCEIDDSVDINDIFDFISTNKLEELNIAPTFNYERVIYIVKKLLVTDSYITIDVLLDEIYVGKTTLLLHLKEAKKILAKYRLSVVTKHKNGMKICGSEIDKRLCICEFFFHYNYEINYHIKKNNIYKINDRENYDQILLHVKETIKKYNIAMSDYSINNITIHLLILISRCQINNSIMITEFSDEKVEDIIYKAALNIAQKMECIFNLELSNNEVIYIMQHLKNKQILLNDNFNNVDRVNVNKCLHIIIEEVRNNFAIDLKSDFEFYNCLYLHIPQMVKRIKDNMIMRNPLVFDNLRRYLFATKVTHSAVNIIENIYKIKVDINEMGYLVLYFNLAICKVNSHKKIKIALISGRGRAETLMYFNEIKENFNNEKYMLYNYDYDKFIENKENIDYVISTYITDTYKIPKYIIKDDNYLESILYELRQLSLNNLDLEKYIKPEYFYFDIQGDTNELIMENIYQWFIENEYINTMTNDDQFEVVELGNTILHLQDLHRIVRQELCFIGTLKKPIIWDNQVVKIIIFTKTKRDGDKDLSDLCKILSIWCSDLNEIDKFLKNPNYEYFIKSINNWRK